MIIKEKAVLRQRRQVLKGFTLVQLLIVIGLISIVAAMSFGNLQKSRRTARLATCDANVKAVALALDAYRQEEGHFPEALPALVDKKLLESSIMRCPQDPDADSAGYAEYYVLRQPRGDADRPILVCPFHENRQTKDKQTGVQAYGGRYTKRHDTMYATLTQANSATVQQPGEAPMAGAGGMILRGGDRVRTGAAGGAVISFTDGSTATLKNNADVTVLQSFLDSQVTSPTLYTLVKQVSGSAVYYVNHGSKFDVATPTATAGARGTEFEITITQENGEPVTSLKVLDGQVAFNTTLTGTVANVGNLIENTVDGLLNLLF